MEEKRRRRSSRERRSRYVEIDGYNVLRLNNYSLEHGEMSVFDSEARGQAKACSTGSNARSAFQIFLADFRESSNHDMSTFMKMASEMWRSPDYAPGTPLRGKYELLAEQERVEIDRLRREEERAASELRRKEIEETRRKALELERISQQKKSAPMKRVQKKKKQKTPEEIARHVHNQNVRARMESKREKRMKYFSYHKKVIEPLISSKTSRILSGITTENEDENLEILDTQGAPCLTQPSTIVRGTMRSYQLKGLEWLLHMFDNGLSPILGDEMGLGKTLQTISFLAALKERNIGGPHLVVVPLSVMSSWLGEFRKWCPTLRVVRIHTTDRAERERIRKEVLGDIRNYDVALTTYEYLLVPEMRHALYSRVTWRCVVLDEGHKVKNESSLVSQAVRKLKAECVVLLTGTPLQNNLTELWAVLNFLYPRVFDEKAKVKFANAFELSTSTIQIDRDTLNNAHYVLRLIMLRRLKTEVEQKLPKRLEAKIMCPLSRMQQFWYKRILLKDSSLLERLGQNKDEQKNDDDELDVVGREAGNDWAKLQSLMMQLRKVCNHPFLFPNAEAAVEASFSSGAWKGQCTESIVTSSGKMEMLDRLLRRLKSKGHRVVIFSQFTQMLDIVDDFLVMRGYEFARLDGSTNRVQRYVDIHEFNKKDSPYFCFIMSTRAGGMGINLQTADTVILMDSDWNPQVDLQAMARVHRIGQTKTVHVYRLVSSGTMEERIVQRAQKKLFLDAMVNRGSTAAGMQMDRLDTKAMLKAITFGMDRVFGEGNSSTRYLNDKEIDRIIDRNVTQESLNKISQTENENVIKTSAADFDESTALVALRDFQGKVYGDKKKKGSNTYNGIAEAWIEELSDETKKRERKTRFVNVDGHTVLKQNMYTMESGEKSVFEANELIQKKDKEDKGVKANSTLAAILASTTGRQIAGRDYDHQDFCQACLDGGDLIVCDYCPAAYHAECVGLKGTELNRIGRWTCPHHTCMKCSRKSQAVGGLLFRCEMCPVALCEDHLTADAQSNITNKCARFQALGQRHPAQACFVLCSEECKQRHEISRGGLDCRAIFSGNKKNVGSDAMTTTTNRARTPSPVPEELEKLVAPLRKSDWNRLSIATQTHENAIQRRLLIAVSTNLSPISLAQVPGFRERWSQVAYTTKEAVKRLLAVASEDDEENTNAGGDDIMSWSGVRFQRRDDFQTKCEKAASMYLRLVRILQMQGANRIFQNYHIRDLIHLLGLRMRDSKGTKNSTKPIVVNRTANLGQAILAELASVFLTFPGGRCLQIMDESFFLEEDRTGWTSEEDEEDENEDEMEVHGISSDQQQQEQQQQLEQEDDDITTQNQILLAPLVELVDRVAAVDDPKLKKDLKKKKKKKRKISEEDSMFDIEACETAMLWIRRAVFSRHVQEDKLNRGMTAPAISKAATSLAKHLCDLYGPWLEMNQEQICNHLKVWFVPKKLEALLNSKKRKALKTLPKGWESSSNSSFISPHSGRRFRSKNIALEAVHLFSDPICTPLLLGELAVRSLFSNETKRMRHLEREAEPLLDALRELLPDPEKIATKFGFTFENNENEEDEKDEQEKTLQRRRRRGRRIILAPSRDSFKDMCAKLEKPCTRRVKKEPKLPPEVPSENSLKRRYVFPIINLLKKLCFGRQSRHGRKDNIEALEKLMEDAGWEVKQRHAFGGMVLYFPPMPDLNFEDTDSEEESSSEEEEESSSEEEEESSSEEEDREKMDVEEGNDNEKEEGKDVESKDDEEEDSSEDSSESEEREEAPRIRSFEAALQWVQGHQDDLVEAARQRATLERREKIEALPDFVWGREKLGPKKTRIQRVQNHLEMMKTQFFDRFLEHSTQHKIIMREAAEEAARLLQSVVSIRKCGFEISIPVRVGRAARAFARLGSSIVSSPSDLKRLQEAAQVFVSENKSDQNLDRTYAISEKVECRWNGKDEFYTAVVDAVNDDGTYRLVYEDGDKEDHVADYLLRLPGDEEVVVKTSVGLEFYGRRGLRSAFGIVDYTNRCREELERLHSSSSSSLGRMSSSSPKRKKKKRRKRR